MHKAKTCQNVSQNIHNAYTYCDMSTATRNALAGNNINLFFSVVFLLQINCCHDGATETKSVKLLKVKLYTCTCTHI